MQSKTKNILLLLGILFIAACLRFYALDKFPPGLYPDEAVNATDALQALEKEDLQAYYPNNNGREGLFINLLALSFKFFGVTINTLRMIPAIIGLLTILAVYLLGKEIINQTGGLIASFLVAVSYWHLNFSRVGFRAILVPLVLSLSFYLLFKGYRILKNKNINKKSTKQRLKKAQGSIGQFFQKIYSLYSITGKTGKNKNGERTGRIYFLLAGLVFGIGFHTYLAFRVSPAIVVVFFLLICLVNFKNRLELKRLIIVPSLLFLLGTLLTASPIFYHFFENPEHLGARQNDNSISVLDSKNNNGQLVLAVSKTFLQTFGQFFYKGDMNWRHNLPPNSQLFAPIALLFLVGIVYIFSKMIIGIIVVFKTSSKNKKADLSDDEVVKFGTILAWFLIMLSPAFLTVEGLPHALRSIGSLPVAYLIASIPLVFLLKRSYSLPSSSKKTAPFLGGLTKILVFSTLALTLIYNSVNYFVIWGESTEAAHAFEKRLVNIGQYLGNSKKDNQYLIVNQEAKIIETGYPVSLETIKFFNYNKNKQVIYLHPEELNKIKIQKDTEIILQKTDPELIKKLEYQYSLKAISIPDKTLPEIEFVVLR